MGFIQFISKGTFSPKDGWSDQKSLAVDFNPGEDSSVVYNAAWHNGAHVSTSDGSTRDPSTKVNQAGEEGDEAGVRGYLSKCANGARTHMIDQPDVDRGAQEYKGKARFKVFWACAVCLETGDILGCLSYGFYFNRMDGQNTMYRWASRVSDSDIITHFSTLEDSVSKAKSMGKGHGGPDQLQFNNCGKNPLVKDPPRATQAPPSDD